MKELFFKDWTSLWHVALCAVIAYLVLFFFIRISGKRTLAKLNAFDFVVSVTLGSTLSSMILAKVALLEGFIALVIIIGLQYLLAWSAKESTTMENIINDKPTLLFYNGLYIESAMKKEVITESEILAEIRKYRLYHIEDVMAVVMELNGEITVVSKSNGSGKTSLQDVPSE